MTKIHGFTHTHSDGTRITHQTTYGRGQSHKDHVEHGLVLVPKKPTELQRAIIALGEHIKEMRRG